MSYTEPPPRLPLLYRIMLKLVEKRLGKTLLANRILSWYPRAAYGAAIMEGLVAHDEPDGPPRLLALLRIQTSFLVSRPFCLAIDSPGVPAQCTSDEKI